MFFIDDDAVLACALSAPPLILALIVSHCALLLRARDDTDNVYL